VFLLVAVSTESRLRPGNACCPSVLSFAVQEHQYVEAYRSEGV
jgi:hypothetical protein